MKRAEIMAKMLTKEPSHLWYPMEFGGNVRQLQRMEDDGLIKSQRRYLGGNRQRDFYRTDEQHAAATKGAVV